MGKHWSDSLKPQEKVEKPCSQCGYDAFITQRVKSKNSLYYVQCWSASCGLMTSGCKTKEKAIKIWENDR